MGIAVDSNGNVYISDTNNHKIQKRTSHLQQIITEWGQYDSGNGEFNQPYGIAADLNNDIFVANRLNHRVQRFNADGTHINNIGTSGNVEFRSPFGVVAIDSSYNSVYVSDNGYNSIQTFTKDGVYYKPKFRTTTTLNPETSDHIPKKEYDGITEEYYIDLTDKNRKQVIEDIINKSNGSTIDNIIFYGHFPGSIKGPPFRCNQFTYDQFINCSLDELERLART